jgi:cyclopropane-fatty-acyl-phospholipid synthase
MSSSATSAAPAASVPGFERLAAPLIGLAERGWLPDVFLRWGCRHFGARRLAEMEASSDGAPERLLERLREAPIAVDVGKANEQHYELPPAFFAAVLGARLKYSCAYWPPGVGDLDAAEEAMLDLTCRRAAVEDGMRILDLGCGWGSLTTWIAERYPRCTVQAVSNSRPQAAFIAERCRARGLANATTETADVNDFAPSGRFDRVLSVEMFEHVRNPGKLLGRVASWCEPDGRIFLHVFSHARYAYLFEAAGPGDWMARTFFTGGMMPSHDLYRHLQQDVILERDWRLDGTHYEKTSNAWLARLDARRDVVLDLFRSAYGAGDAARWLMRWRLFFMACAEVFGHRSGSEWGVTHLRFRPRS